MGTDQNDSHGRSDSLRSSSDRKAQVPSSQEQMGNRAKNATGLLQWQIQEATLVGLALNALQGLSSALDNLERLSSAFCSEPADRSSHRLPSLWHRSSSTNALGKILKSIGHSGLIFYLLRKFVHYFLGPKENLGGENRNNKGTDSYLDSDKRGNLKDPESEKNQKEINCTGEIGVCPPYSLVNQAFAVAVEKILAGYVCALNTLFESVRLRRSLEHNLPGDDSSEAGCLTSVTHSEITVLEVYLHTKELRTRIEALGNICLLKNVHPLSQMSAGEEFATTRSLEFHNFPRGADLLTHLYIQIRDADPVHHEFLKFLFIRSCEPYCGLIKSWIYQASINDPYKEFIVECVEGAAPYQHNEMACTNASAFPSITVRYGVSVPCFLEDVCSPLLRAGQQLQILIKLLDLCNSTFSGDQSYSQCTLFNLANLEDILPCWTTALKDHISWSSPSTFSKRNIEAMTLQREDMYRMMKEKLHKLFASLNIRCWQLNSSVIPSCMVPGFLDSRKICLNIPISLMSDGCLISSPSVPDKEATSLVAGADDPDASSISEKSSYEEESFEEDSECSSLYSFEEKNELARPVKLLDSLIVKEPPSLSSLQFLRDFHNENIVEKPLGHEIPRALGHSSLLFSPHNMTERTEPITKWSRSPKILDGDCHPSTCWPLVGLLRNPFFIDDKYRSYMQPRSSACSQNLTANGMADLKREVLHYEKVNVSNNSDLELSASESLPGSGEHDVAFNVFVDQSLNLQKNYNFLNINPMLSKNPWWHTIGRKTFVPYFDFSSVEDPCKTFVDARSLVGPDHGCQIKIPGCTDSGVSTAKGVGECLGVQCRKGEEHQLDIPVERGGQTCKSFSVHSSTSPKENAQKSECLRSDFGGAKWESLLSYSGNDVRLTAVANCSSQLSRFDVPLEVIVDKCIVHEIFLQYKYVSSFTLKLLEEGFDLQAHLSALRRYHFMELADWADSFIMSLRHHKWYAAEANQSISKIHGLLCLAVQRSSCEKDQCKERLFVYIKGEGVMPFSSGSIDIHAFDFIALGYRVDWPINIVITPVALKIYSAIFSFLIQIKLAVFALTDIWRSLKDLTHAISHSRDSGFGKGELKYFHVLLKTRQQVNHFIATLQQYVQSQLLHKAWSKFLHSLKYQVKDVLDLESVHMAYLSDTLQICFLPAETHPAAKMIESILQCALDFRSCFIGGSCVAASEKDSLSNFLSQINFSQVFMIKAKFEESLKGMHLCYLKSSKHSEFSLSRFWEHLNYNHYFSNILGKEASL